MRRGTRHTVESKARISQALTGDGNPMKGRRREKDSKAAQSKAMRKVWQAKRDLKARRADRLRLPVGCRAEFAGIRTFQDDIAESVGAER